MANYNKSFNFRNGVQVDNDNFIVNANGLVGIGTSIPTEFLDVYGTAKITGLVTTTNLAVSGVSTFYNDVKVGSAITISPSTGAVRANTFYGSAAGLTGIYAIAVSGWYVDNANSGIYTSFKVGIGTTNPQYSLQVGQNPSTGNGFSVNGTTGNVNASGDVNIGGSATAYSFIGFGTDIQGINASNINNGTLSNSRLASNISVSGIITATSGFVGSLTGTATTASSLSGTPNITVGNVTSSNIYNSAGIITSANIISGISSVGVSTVSTRLYAESIGVGTNSPSSDIHIRRTSTSKLQVTSDSAEAIIAIGRSTTLTGSNGALIFGNTAGIYPYSNSKTLDIVNYDTGNINQYLQYGSAGIGTGNFNWIYSPDSTNPLMSLTYKGNLGLGVTNPTVKLQVSGIASVTALVTQSITATSNIVANGSISATGSATSTSVRTLYVYGGRSQILNSNGTEIFPTGTDSNLNLTSGISTFFDINVTNNGIFGGRIGIGLTLPPLDVLHIGGNYLTDPEGAVVISSGGIGIGTTARRFGAGIDATSVDSHLGTVGIGTTIPDIPDSPTRLYVGGDSEFYGKVAIGTTDITDQLTVRGGDISVGTNNSHGVVLTSPNGTKYRLVVNNAGALSTVLVP